MRSNTLVLQMLVLAVVVTWVRYGLASDLLASNYSKVSLSGTAYSSASVKIGHNLWVTKQLAESSQLHDLCSTALHCFSRRFSLALFRIIRRNRNISKSCYVSKVRRIPSVNYLPLYPSELMNRTTPISVSWSEFSQSLKQVAAAASSFTRRALQRTQVGLGVTAHHDEKQRRKPIPDSLVPSGLPWDWTYVS